LEKIFTFDLAVVAERARVTRERKYFSGKGRRISIVQIRHLECHAETSPMQVDSRYADGSNRHHLQRSSSFHIDPTNNGWTHVGAPGRCDRTTRDIDGTSGVSSRRPASFFARFFSFSLFPFFPRKISRQDGLGTTIAHSVDPSPDGKTRVRRRPQVKRQRARLVRRDVQGEAGGSVYQGPLKRIRINEITGTAN
jgi:hypothetical protein